MPAAFDPQAPERVAPRPPRAPSTDRSLKIAASVAFGGAVFFLKLVSPGDSPGGGVRFEELAGLAALMAAAVLAAVIFVRRRRRTTRR